MTEERKGHFNMPRPPKLNEDNKSNMIHVDVYLDCFLGKLSYPFIIGIDVAREHLHRLKPLFTSSDEFPMGPTDEYGLEATLLVGHLSGNQILDTLRGISPAGSDEFLRYRSNPKNNRLYLKTPASKTANFANKVNENEWM